MIAPCRFRAPSTMVVTKTWPSPKVNQLMMLRFRPRAGRQRSSARLVWRRDARLKNSYGVCTICFGHYSPLYSDRAEPLYSVQRFNGRCPLPCNKGSADSSIQPRPLVDKSVGREYVFSTCCSADMLAELIKAGIPPHDIMTALNRKKQQREVPMETGQLCAPYRGQQPPGKLTSGLCLGSSRDDD